jgi:hypothetical protein
MANFQTHISVSTALGIGYAGVGLVHEVPLDSCLLAAGLCSVAGMLPDVDSDSGVPFRETMAFLAAVVPMLLVDRFRQIGMSHEAMALSAVVLYGAIRFGAGEFLRRYTVHRGMFHSIPAAIVFAEAGFLIFGSDDLRLRLYKSGAILAGFLSHLLLDEVYSVEWYRGRMRLKQSFGTALKLWGESRWGNLSTYVKLILLSMLVAREPVVQQWIESARAGRVEQAASGIFDSELR